MQTPEINKWDRKTHSVGEALSIDKDDVENVRGRMFKNKNDQDFMACVIEMKDGSSINCAQDPATVRRYLGIMSTPEGDDPVNMYLPKPRGL